MKKTITLKNIAAACGVMLGAALQAQPYCVTNLGGNFNCSGTDFITNVTILNTSLNNNSTCNYVNNQAYTAFAPSGNTTCNLILGQTYSLSIFTGAQNIESFWFDFDQSGTFDPGEWTQPTTSSIANAATVATFTVPFTAVLGNTGLRVRSRAWGNPNGAGDACLNFGSGECEDYTVTIIPGTPCSTTPGANTVAVPSGSICPNTAINLMAASPYTLGAITYTWATATNSVGPFTTVQTGTNAYYNTGNLTTSTWYQVTAACLNGGPPVIWTPGQVGVSPTITNSVTYFEGFEGTPSNTNQLPNCSWTRSNPTNCQTSTVSTFSNRVPNTGNGYANFDYGGNGTSNTYDFYSNGIQLNAGVTYSASLWYITPGGSFQTFKFAYGPSQSVTSQSVIGIVTNPNNSTYKSLSNTFQVATSGIYYLNISVTDNFNYSYLTFDDVSIIAPCTVPQNSINLGLSAPPSVCSGSSITLVASGANTYSWSTGSTTSSISVSPTVNTTYSVTGTNTLSNCSYVLTNSVLVRGLPGVQIYAPVTSVCENGSVILYATGSAGSYVWGGGPAATGTTYTASPSTTTTYSLIGTDAFGCSSTAVQTINWNQAPTIGVTGNNTVCVNEGANLTGTGATSYTWSSNSVYLQSANVIITPGALGTFTYLVTGKDANDCVNTTVASITTDKCVGIASVYGNISNLAVYPNPNNGVFTISLGNGTAKTIEVMDVTGRVILSENSSLDQTDVNITNLTNGVYYVKVKSGGASEVLKIVKQ